VIRSSRTAALLAVSLSLASLSTAIAQQARTGVITGRVVTEGGQPLPRVGVKATPINAPRRGVRVTGTDEQGRFKVEGLSPGAYSLSVAVPGYVQLPFEPGRKHYRIGESVTVTMAKGGVITGTVTNFAGEPVVTVRVRLLRVRDDAGRQTAPSSDPAEVVTDDRGVYRAYGLDAGAYLVVAGGSFRYVYGDNAYKLDAPTYHPSSTADNAAEVTVRLGEEVSGIDIRYRGGPGFAVSGAVTGTPAGSTVMGADVSLIRADSGAVHDAAYVALRSANRGFGFYGVTNGEYYAVARGMSRTDDGVDAASAPRRVVVKDADVTGVELPFSSLASVAGRIAVEPAQKANLTGCKDLRDSMAIESVVVARRDQKTAQKDVPEFLSPSSYTAAPDGNGAFVLSSLDADSYRIEVQLPGEKWYVRSMTPPSSDQPGGAAKQSRNDIAVKAGARLVDLVITLSEGAASVSGRVTPAPRDEAGASRLHVHVVPAESEFAGDVLRYHDTSVESGGAFTLSNLAPGRYWIVVRPAPDDELRPLAWDEGLRNKLRSEAESANNVIKLKPCERKRDFALRLGGR